jgi:hypothetical protein
VDFAAVLKLSDSSDVHSSNITARTDIAAAAYTYDIYR